MSFERTPTTVRSKQVVEAARFPVEPDPEGLVEACAVAVWGPRQHQGGHNVRYLRAEFRDPGHHVPEFSEHDRGW
ncbi:hypothetical protein MTO96_046445 [Rhipicephalus appendiculatus]